MANNNGGGGAGYFEISVDVASGQIEVTRDEHEGQMGALLDHGPGSATVNLERTWAVLRLVFGTFLVVSGIGMVAVSAVEWSSSSAECSLQLRPWLLVQAVSQLCAVPLSLFSRWLISGARRRARTCGVVALALSARVVNLFLFSWFVVGMVWLVASFNPAYHCRDRLPLTWYSMTVFLMVEMVAIFIATAGLVFSCIILAARMMLLANGGAMREVAGRRGASAEEITEHSELRTYAADMFADVEDAKCVVCLGEYEAGDELRFLRCNHHFHKECLDEWLKRQGSCPLCVRQLGDVPTATNDEEQEQDFED